MLIVNGLGSLDNDYGPAPPGPKQVISPTALADAKASGLSAINLSLAWGDDFGSTVAAIAAYDRFIREHPNDLLKVFTTEDILRAKKARKIGVIYGFQNAAMVGDEPERIDAFADFGIRAIQLTYNAPNQLGGGSMAPGDPGLTPFGRQIVERLNTRRIMVDLSHSGTRMCLDASKASKQPISINHTGCRAITDLPRNKTDEELRAVADKGGYVGIYFIMYLTKGRAATIDDVLAHMDHAIQVCGEDHVGFGSDYGIVRLGDMKAQWDFWAHMLEGRKSKGEMASGEDPRILPFATGLIGPDQFRNLIQTMDRHGYSARRIEKIMGLNFLNYAKTIWGA
jgi:membrane dipeptidase